MCDLTLACGNSALEYRSPLRYIAPAMYSRSLYALAAAAALTAVLLPRDAKA